MGASLRILLVEDSAGDALLLRAMFSKESAGSFVLTHVARMKDALRHLSEGNTDIVLLDLGLPDGHGLDTVRRARAAAPGIPLIVLTGMDDESLAAQAIKEGAQDYLIKGQIENRALPRALRYAIERHRMQADTELLRKQQLQLKDEFLSHVSHELRSPLTAIYQFVTILLDGLAGELTPEQREYLEITLKNSRQLKSMIDDLLEVTSVQAGKSRIELQLVSIPELLADTVMTLQGAAQAKNISLSCDVSSQVSSAYADPTRVRQIIIILVDNALKFTPPDGTVKVRASISKRDARSVLIEVADTGCGIQADMTERIFERLYQAPDAGQNGRQGLGLGLHICKELVTRQGGTIWARNELGKGAILSFTLPVFSVASLIAPAFRVRGADKKSIALLVTAIGSKTGWLSREARVESSHHVREVLGRCMHSDVDVLLPKMRPGAATEFFFIVAVTDEIGAEAMTRRVREKLAVSDVIKQSGLTVTAFYRLLRPPARTPSEEFKDYVGRIAVQIQESVDEEMSPKEKTNGQ